MENQEAAKAKNQVAASLLPSRNSWAGQAAYLVLGGPSLKEFDFSLLANRPNVLCVNMSYKSVPTAWALFSEDVRFVERAGQREDYKAFRGLRIYSCLEPSYEPAFLNADPKALLLHRYHDDKFWSDKWEEGLSYSSNSAIGALNILDILGASPIYILGLDCCSVRGGPANYHNDYPEDWRTPDTQLESFASDFTYWAAIHLKRSERRVINLNVNSAVRCWPQQDWREVLAS